MGDTTSTQHFTVIVVGSGPVGLTTAWRLAKLGHQVKMIEKKACLNGGGGDIQLSSNAVTAIQQIGLEPWLSPVANAMDRAAFMDYKSTVPICEMPTDMTGNVSSLMFRRDDLVKALYDAVLSTGTEVHFNKTVSKVSDNHPPVLYFEDGNQMSADLIVGADGIRSRLRELLFPDRDTRAVQMNHAAFQWSVPYRVMAEEPDTLALWEHGKSTLQVTSGINGFLTSWSNAVRGEFFMCFCEKDYQAPPRSAGIWDKKGDMNEVRGLYQDWAETFQKILRKSNSCEVWHIVDSVEGADWVSPGGKFVLVGDAIHAMPPYVAQGLSQGIEDATALGEFLKTALVAEQIPKALRSLETFRSFRTKNIQTYSRAAANVWMLPEGTERQARDNQWDNFNHITPEMLVDSPMDPHAGPTDPGYAKWVRNYDIMKEAQKYLQSVQ